MSARLIELKKGRFYKLLSRIGAIPAGVYRFEGASGARLMFSLGGRRSVRFFLYEVERTLIAPVTYKVGRSQGIGVSDFFDQVCYNIELGVQEAVVLAVKNANIV